jgi:hypothetical protein
MADPVRGKKALQSVEEYPLPKRSDARDYLFYFVPATDGYGRGARAFFDKFYPNHVRVDASSLEDLINKLANEVAAGVKQIREIVMVAHGNSQGLIVPLLNGVTDTNLKEYKYWTAFSLACLQKDIDGKFASFRDKRKKVIAHLQNDSWVTIRACNFGNTKEGMYASFSFFGGRANVYAPKMYQFFGSQPIMQGMKLDTKLSVHEHLVKQHFLPRDVHTPERRDMIVRALLEKGQFSEPFEVATMPVDSPSEDDSKLYEGLIDDLNAGKINDFIKNKFKDNEFEISKSARLSTVNRDTSWLIKDAIRHDGTDPQHPTTFAIEYEVYETVGFSDRTNKKIATLHADARLVNLYSAHEFVPVQLFFSSEENDQWRGKIATLASYQDAPNLDAHAKAKFDSILIKLKAGDAGIKSDFDASQVELTSQPRIKQQSVIGKGDLQRIVWTVDDQDHHYQVKLEHPTTPEGELGHALSVLSNPDSATRLKLEYELMARLGSDPDTPGTELPASLDRLTLADVTGIVDYLRSPFKPGNSFYLNQAIEALIRKKEFRKWSVDNDPINPNAVLPDGNYSMLSHWEEEDKRSIAYDFDFDNTWAEVKSSNPLTVTIQEDLFAEEDLVKKLKIPDELIADRNLATDIESDSPYTDIEELRKLEKLGLERFFSTDKVSLEPVDTNKADCEELADALAKWKKVKDLEPEAMREILSQEKTESGKNVLDVIFEVSNKYMFLKEMLELVDLAEHLHLPSLPSKKEIVKQIIKRVPFLSRITWLRAVLEVEAAITIPIEMWLEFAETQQEAEEAWKYKGQLVAMRQWLRRLNFMTYEKEDNFPDRPVVDISRPTGADSLAATRYFDENVACYGVGPPLVTSPEALEEGYREVMERMDAVEDELLHQADEAVSETLIDSDLGSCKIQALKDAGILDEKKMRALIIRQLTEALLNKLPKV